MLSRRVAAGQRILQRFPLSRPLATRDFRLLWVGDSVSLLGSQFSTVAWSWLVLQLTGSGLALGTVLFVGSIPRMVLLLIGGAVTDRLSPWKVSLAANLILGATLGTFSLLTLTHQVHLWQVYVGFLLFGTVNAFGFPALFALIPRTLPQEQLTAGNALMESTNGLTAFLGPALAGLLIASLGGSDGIGLAFVLDAASFMVAAISFQLMSATCKVSMALTTVGAEGGEARRLLRSIAEGLRLAWQDPGLRAFLFLLAVSNLAFYGPFRVGLAALAAHRFAGGAPILGSLYGAWGAGVLIGTFVAGFVGRLRRYGLLLLAGATIQGAAFGLIGFAPTALVATFLVAIIGMESGIGNVIFGSWLQMRTAPDQLGRVMSLVGLANLGVTPISYAASGALVDLSPTLTFVLAGGIILGSVAFASVSRTVRTIA